MAVKAISEFKLQPDRRAEFVHLFETLVAEHLESMRAVGCHSATIYVDLDDPNRAVEISEWESAEARQAMMHSDAMAAFAPLFELLAAPPNARVIGRMQ